MKLGLKMSDKDDVCGLFERVRDNYSETMDQFREFRYTRFASGWSIAIGALVHNSNRAYSNLKYAIDHDNIPEGQVCHPSWKAYHDTCSAIQMMQFIMWLASLAPEETAYEVSEDHPRYRGMED